MSIAEEFSKKYNVPAGYNSDMESIVLSRDDWNKLKNAHNFAKGYYIKGSPGAMMSEIVNPLHEAMEFTEGFYYRGVPVVYAIL